MPEQPFTAAFGETRKVGKDSTNSVESIRHSVPHELTEQRVWVRFHGDELIVRDGRGQCGRSHPPTALDTGQSADRRRALPRRPERRARTEAENPAQAQLLAIGTGAVAWLVEAAATGVRRIRAKMAEAVALVRLYGAADVDRALGTAATVGRFAEDDLLSILDHRASTTASNRSAEARSTACSPPPPPGQASARQESKGSSTRPQAEGNASRNSRRPGASGAVPLVRVKCGRPWCRSDSELGDRGYDHDKCRRHGQALGVKPVIARRGTEHGSGRGAQR
ncbi:hypothetical protein [Streptomyces sp. NPDC057966]|uniref:Mu transposase domain-containing protein n=1 Tax=Streptomyces sp. NPDC057966 TaxID=3346292 RepID=UPI0036E7BB98